MDIISCIAGNVSIIFIVALICNCIIEVSKNLSNKDTKNSIKANKNSQISIADGLGYRPKGHKTSEEIPRPKTGSNIK